MDEAWTEKKLSRYYICPIVNHSAATFLLLGLYSQKAKLKIKTAKKKSNSLCHFQ
jgi:hypothetical protein